MLLVDEPGQMKKVLQNYMVLDLLTIDTCALFHIKCYIYTLLTFEGVEGGEPLRLLQSQEYLRTSGDVTPLIPFGDVTLLI